MSAAGAPGGRSTWNHWYRRALPAYWIFLFCATHFPRLRLGGPVAGSDKVLHFSAFALLAFLFWRFAETFRRPLGRPRILLIGFVLMMYAALDEYLQQFVGRGTDFDDFVADMLGIALVLSFAISRARLARPWSGRQPVSPSGGSDAAALR